MTDTLPLSDVRVGRRRRPADPAKVRELAVSIGEAGLLHPIVVNTRNELRAGLHRLEAFKLLGRASIPVTVVAAGSPADRLAELDENLYCNQLTVLERAEHLREREVILAGHGARAHRGQNQHSGGGAPGALPLLPEAPSAQPQKTTADIARDLGMSERATQEHLQIARAIAPEAREAVRATPHADSTKTLLDLARVREPAVQEAAAAVLAKHPEMPASDARAVLAVAKAESQKVTSARGAPPTFDPEAEARRRIEAAAEEKRLAREAHREKREARIEEARREAATLPAGEGVYEVIAIDPPWQYDRQPKDSGMRGECDYPTMSMEELRQLRIPAADDCVLWLWTTNAFMGEAFDLLKAWGFTQKTILTWDKERLGLGAWLRNVTEHCILAVKGKPVVQLTNQTTLIREPRREHSRKPEAFYRLVEELCIGRRLEMFARTPRAGWDRHGIETEKFEEVTRA